jgi:large subunit ribosomal protein L18
MAAVSGSAKHRRVARSRRHARVRRKVSGSQDRPRLCVFRSLKNIYAQVIDDVSGTTMVSASSLDKEVRESLGEAKEAKGKMDMSKAVGRFVARRAKEKGIEKVRFDRAGYRFRGRVRALADAAKEGGLLF